MMYNPVTVQNWGFYMSKCGGILQQIATTLKHVLMAAAYRQLTTPKETYHRGVLLIKILSGQLTYCPGNFTAGTTTRDYNHGEMSRMVSCAALCIDVAQAASGVTPSVNNFLLSIGAGGVVLAGILGAIIGDSNFDPVKRG